jgi:hypothetical protein
MVEAKKQKSKTFNFLCKILISTSAWYTENPQLMFSLSDGFSKVDVNLI